MKTKILKIIIPLLIIIFAGYFIVNNKFTPNTAFAVGDLTVNWGVPEGSPIFTISNIAPGQMEQKDVVITNNATANRPVSIRGIKVPPELANLSDALLIQIFDGITSLYGPVNLNQFFTDSGPNGIPLFTLSPSQSKTITFKVTFNPTAGNQYQAGQVVFDLKIGISTDIPPECQNIVFTGNGGNPIFGTQKGENITGTPGNDLIVAFEGDDKIESNNGDDCILGGPGNDRINGNNGNDVLIGEDGVDSAEGNNGQDSCAAETKKNCEL